MYKQVMSVVFILLMNMVGFSFYTEAQATESLSLIVYNPDVHPILVDTLVNQTQEHLNDYDLNLITTNILTPPDITIRVSFINHSDNYEITLGIFDKNAPIHIISSLLHNETALPLEIIVPSDNEEIAIDFAANLLTAFSLYRTEKCEQARSIFETLETHSYLETLEIYYPGWRDGLQFYRGNCALLQSDYEQAVTYYEQAMTYVPHPALRSQSAVTSIDINLAWTYLQVNRADEAFVLLDDALLAIEADKRHRILRKRAQLYALVSDFNSAIADMDEAIAIESENAQLYKERGDIIMLIYEWDRAEENYTQAIALDPYYADAYYSRGVLYYTLLERESALADFEQYLELAPEGQYADQAQQNIESIQLELAALNNEP